VYPRLDPNETKCTRRLERCSTDAGWPFSLGHVSGPLTWQQAGRVRIRRQDGVALVRYHRSSAADARGPFWPSHVSGLLDRRQARRVQVAGQYGTSLGRCDRSGAADARGPFNPTFNPSHVSGLLAGRKARRVWVRRQDGIALGCCHRSSAADARGPSNPPWNQSNSSRANILAQLPSTTMFPRTTITQTCRDSYSNCTTWASRMSDSSPIAELRSQGYPRWPQILLENLVSLLSTADSIRTLSSRIGLLAHSSTISGMQFLILLWLVWVPSSSIVRLMARTTISEVRNLGRRAPHTLGLRNRQYCRALLFLMSVSSSIAWWLEATSLSLIRTKYLHVVLLGNNHHPRYFPNCEFSGRFRNLSRGWPKIGS
jgi:hypothetical protein